MSLFTNMQEMNPSLVLIKISLNFCLVKLGRSEDCGGCTNYGTILTCDQQTCDWQLLNGYWAGNITEREAIY